MNSKDINLIFFDTDKRFNEIKSQISFLSYKSVHQFKEFAEFEDYINKPENIDQYVVIFIHIVAKTLEGYHSGLKDDLKSEYPNLIPRWVTRVSSSIKPNEVDEPVYTYRVIKNKIENETITPHRIKDLLSKTPAVEKELINENALAFSADYAIITALEEDEMEKVLPILIRKGQCNNTKVLIEYGHLKTNPNKKIVYASQPSTGMIDAAIIATELIVRFKPKFLIMAGVLGGKPGDVNIGNIVVSTKAFTIDKGKLTDEELLTEIESVNTDSSFITLFKRKKSDILRYIESLDPTRKSKLDIHFGPIACVRHVVDKKHYFEDKVLNKDKKAIALEMESYGIARACEIVNNGNTTPLIIKSAMDNTVDKVDNAKAYAAWTSACFVRYILENDFI